MLAHSGRCWAGISGENIVVVVNADSIRSRTIANHYVHLRQIPSDNVIMLTGIENKIVIGLEDFKSKILNPLLKEIDRRKLAGQTRCVAYSADFPTSVSIGSHTARLPNARAKQVMGSLASITSMTYFYRFVLADQEGYFAFKSNLYARGKFDNFFVNPFNGEKGKLFDDAKKMLADDKPKEAASEFEKLFDEYPSLAPMAILAAEAYAKADEKSKATELVKRAIQAGWWSATYLRESDDLIGLLGETKLANTLPLLSDHPTNVQGPFAFSSTKGWTQCGYPVRVDQGGMPYMMSCSLAVLHNNGSTLEQAIEVLNRAANADYTFPNGDFRFSNHTDVRAKTRFPSVADALLYLSHDDFKTSVYKQPFSPQPGKAAGVFHGLASIDFSKRKYKLLPGAISETLTSLAGDFSNSGQTKITEYLHAGAAISSGAVMEPYSLQPKFPKAMIHGYYSSGLSAIESFYLSTDAPYQLLIVGDPHCQPFAKRPSATTAMKRSDTSPRKITFTQSDLPLAADNAVAAKRVSRTRFLEVYLEGRFVRQMPAARSVDMELPEEASGVIGVRAVLVGLDPTEPRIAFTKQVDLDGEFAAPTLKTLRKLDATERTGDGSSGKPIEFELVCEGADSIELVHLGQSLGTVNGGSGKLTVETKGLGGGPLRFRPVATFGDTKVAGERIVEGL